MRDRRAPRSYGLIALVLSVVALALSIAMAALTLTLLAGS